MEVKDGYKMTDVGMIPEDWNIKKLETVGVFSKGSGIKRDEVLSEGLPCIRYGEIYTTHHDYIRHFRSFISVEVANQSRKLKRGDLLFAGSGETAEEIGKCVAFLGDELAYAGGDIVILSPSGEDSRFLGYLLNSPAIARQKASRGQGDAVVHISAKNLGNISIPLPPTLAEQRAIAAALSDVDRLLSAYDQLIAKKKAIKQGAMQELLTGRRRLEGFEGEWEERPMNQIAPLQRGFDLPQYKITAGEFPVVFSNGILNHNKQFMVKGPGVVTGRSGTIGQVIFVDKNFWPHNTTLWVTNFYGNDPKFIFYLYRWIGLERFSTGSGVPTLNRNDVHAFKIAIPKINEQTAIAQILTDMDAEISALEQQREKYKAVKAGMMQELLTGKTRLV